MERNISFREVLDKNEILMIDSDYFLSGESYELAKELISNLLDFAHTVAARLANDVKDGITLIDENMDHHYYTK